MIHLRPNLPVQNTTTRVVTRSASFAKNRRLVDLNERPLSETQMGDLNDCNWVVTPTGHSLKEATRQSV